MKTNNPSEKVIDLNQRLNERERKKTMMTSIHSKSETRVIAITSGKGGVGKTNIVANLGLALTQLGKKVLVLDADWGLGNLDVLLGLAPKYNLSHVIMGQKSISEILIDGPGNMKILPASSGIQELTQLSIDQKIRLFTQLDFLVDDVDVLLIDTAAGISPNVMDINVSAQEILVVVSPEPTSLTDAYALMKVLSLKYAERHCKLLVNLTSSIQEGSEIYRQLNLVASRFLNISIEYIGCVHYDQRVTQGVKKQKIVCELYPSTRASRCFTALAKKICEASAAKVPTRDSNFMWDHLVGHQLA